MTRADDAVNSMSSHPADPPRRIGFLLVPGFSMIAFASALEPLRVANRMAGRPLYAWQLLSLDADAVPASNGLLLQTARPAPESDDLSAMIVCAGFDPLSAYSERLARWFRRLDRQGRVLGGIDTGAFLLAAAGLLDGFRATVHWEALGGFTEIFPAVETRSCLFEIDRRRITCAGGTAALDMMLEMIRTDHGGNLSAAVSEQFIYTNRRRALDAQRLSVPARYGTHDPRLNRAIAMIEDGAPAPRSIAAIARELDLSPRQLNRIFAAGLGTSPKTFERERRLAQAQSLIEYSDDPLTEIAFACGFGSYEHFSRSYRKAFGISPSDDRRRASARARRPEPRMP